MTYRAHRGQFSVSGSGITYCLLSILVLLPFLFALFGSEKTLSTPVSISISAVLITICFLLNFKECCNRNDILIVTLTGVFLIITAVIHGNMGVVVTFYNLLLLLILLNNLQIEKKRVQRLRFFQSLLLSVLLFSFQYKFYYGYIYVYKKIDLSVELINPNTFALLALALYFNLFLLISQSAMGKGLKKVLLFFIGAAAVIVIYLSACRSALFALFLFFVLHFIKKWRLLKYKKVLLGLMLFMVIFPPVYLWMNNHMASFMLLGKSFFTGRQNVWRSAFDFIRSHLIFGSGTDNPFQIGSGRYTDSAHNTFLGFWKTVGIVPAAAFFAYALRGKNIAEVTGQNIAAKKMFLCCILICSVETLLNDSDLYIFYVFLLLTIKQDCAAEENDDTQKDSLLLVRRKTSG